MDRLSDNVRAVRERIERCARKAGRNPDEITLVAVTKTIPVERVEEAIRAGLTVLGENRVQEAREKIARIGRRAEWHLVGHLQSNKANLAAGLFQVIHSVDSASLARRLDRAFSALHGGGDALDVLVQVNVSGEGSKAGLDPGRLLGELEEITACGQLRVRGLMTIPPLDPDPERSRPYYAALRALAEKAREAGFPRAPMKDLSMGMTDDYPVAVEEGATLVRIGRALFGERD
jgi:pyridoxal phosphate enzyme (YggS family)